MIEKIYSIGTLWKKEKLASLQWEIDFNELVLEDLDPLPGYYDHFEIPSQEKDLLPRWIFVVLSSLKSCDDDKIIRITQQIRKKYSKPFEAAAGQITLGNDVAPCIRFQISDYKYLPELLKLYAKSGVEFASNRKVTPYTSLIKINKFFDMKPLADHIYQDNDLDSVYYIEISRGLSWHAFEQVTGSVKNNAAHKVFDAALALAYIKNGVVDLVRIYDRHTNLEILTDLRDKFRKETERLG